MYSMEKVKARVLWEESRRMVDVMVRPSRAMLIQVAVTGLTPGDYPLWVAQAQFIHAWYAAWAGDNKLLEWSFSRRGQLAIVIPWFN